MADYLAAGIDPDTATIFTHSAVPALHQLMLPFLSLVTVAELHRNPTVKAERARPAPVDGGLLLTYPVHQAADILFCHGRPRARRQDQLPHLERPGRSRAGSTQTLTDAVLRQPEALLTEPRAAGAPTARKMSKSRGNAIELRRHRRRDGPR